MRCIASKMFISLFDIIDNNSFYARPPFDEFRSFPRLKPCILRESVHLFKFDDVSHNVGTALDSTRHPVRNQKFPIYK